MANCYSITKNNKQYIFFINRKTFFFFINTLDTFYTLIYSIVMKFHCNYDYVGNIGFKYLVV